MTTGRPRRRRSVSECARERPCAASPCGRAVRRARFELDRGARSRWLPRRRKRGPVPVPASATRSRWFEAGAPEQPENRAHPARTEAPRRLRKRRRTAVRRRQQWRRRNGFGHHVSRPCRAGVTVRILRFVSVRCAPRALRSAFDSSSLVSSWAIRPVARCGLVSLNLSSTDRLG